MATISRSNDQIQSFIKAPNLITVDKKLYFELSAKVVLLLTNGNVTYILHGGHFEYGVYDEILLYRILKLLKHPQNISCVKFKLLG